MGRADRDVPEDIEGLLVTKQLLVKKDSRTWETKPSATAMKNLSSARSIAHAEASFKQDCIAGARDLTRAFAGLDSVFDKNLRPFRPLRRPRPWRAHSRARRSG